MPRKTAEEKRLEREAEEAQRKQEKEAFRLTMPARLMRLSALAQQVGIETNIRLIENGVSLKIQNESKPYIDSTLTYDSEEWEVDMVESELNSIKAEIDARAARRALAQEVWAKLSADEKAAVKENIYSLF